MNSLIQKALKAKRESKTIDFKGSLDLAEPHSWCEIIKDIVAMANSGGGVILVGLDNVGKPSGFDATPISTVDPAVITDKIYKYTGIHFSNFELSDHIKQTQKVLAICIYSVSVPIIFIKPGTYNVAHNKQKTAFSVGTVYFRHGAKSEPGTSNDLRKVIERQLDTVRKTWLQGVRKVVKAPAGTSIIALPAGSDVVETTSQKGSPIRITDDPSAPAYRKLDYDHTHPYRQKDLIQVLNERLKGKVTVNHYDIRCIKIVHDVASDEKFCHHPKFSTTQYSPAFADWVEQQHNDDCQFFVKLRKKAGNKKKKAQQKDSRDNK
ncbi:TPA: hypothetical protein DE059_03705 [Candidatus Peribacteria bacterium]|nr:hypothetical protein [Candidatus Peribacteria bacterium]|tara:strand:- start:293 stop:1255 length:963 start_codon:yes stop_codon:yes gene_type:complete